MSEIKEFKEIPIDKIKISEHNVRDDIPPMRHLERSITEKGVLQPIIVRETDGREYEVIAGQLRVIACKELETETIPAIVKDIDSEEEIEESLIENVTKTELSEDEEAEAVAMLYEKYPSLNKLSHVLGRSRRWVADRLKIKGLIDAIDDEGVELSHPLPGVKKTADISRVVLRIWKRQPNKIIEFINKTNYRSREEMKQILDVVKENPEKSVDEILRIADKKIESKAEQENSETESESKKSKIKKSDDDKEMEIESEDKEGKKQKTRRKQETSMKVTIECVSIVSRGIVKCARDRNISNEDVIQTALKEWLKKEGYID